MSTDVRTPAVSLVRLLATVLTAIPLPAAADAAAGQVVDPDGAPVAGVVVTFDQEIRVVTGADGRFAAEIERGVYGNHVAAALPGAVITSFTLAPDAPLDAIELVLEPIPEDAAEPFAPAPPTECTHCHGTYGRGWEGTGAYTGSAHARASTNPTVLDVFLGTASGRTDAASCAASGGAFETVTGPEGTPIERCYVGIGYLRDINPQCGHDGQPRCDDRAAPAEARPTEWGDCAGCHTPAAAVRLPAQLDLIEAARTPAWGSVTCAVCHRITEVLDPNLPGVLRGAHFTRAPDTPYPFALGPLEDPNPAGMRAGFMPLLGESRLCAVCHQDTDRPEGMNPRWDATGVPSEQTYAEWLESAWAASGGRTCQSCHQPSLADLGIAPSSPELAGGGPRRSPEEMHTHDFPPLTDPDAIAEAIDLRVEARREGDEIVVDVEVENRGVGHGFPSGVTSRNVLLLVGAMGPDGALAAIGGEVVPGYAGALAEGSIVTQDGAELELDAAPAEGAVGAELRAWRDGGEVRVHESFGLLRSLPVEERGLTTTEALGQWEITGVSGDRVTVAVAAGASLPDLTGAHFAIGDARHLAGHPGTGFAKVTVAADGALNVPFWRATDLVYDNRIAPYEVQRSAYRFVSPGPGEVRLGVTLVYRKTFLGLAEQRGWDLEDRVLAKVDVTLDAEVPDAGPALDAGNADAGLPAPSDDGCDCHAAGGGRRSTLAGLLVAMMLLASWIRVSPRRRSAHRALRR